LTQRDHDRGVAREVEEAAEVVGELVGEGFAIDEKLAGCAAAVLEGGRRGDRAEQEVEVAEEALPGRDEAVPGGDGVQVLLRSAGVVLPDVAEQVGEGLLIGSPLTLLRLGLNRIEPS
jgi:hypothetical protein